MHVAAGFMPAFKFHKEFFCWYLNAGIKPAATCSLKRPQKFLGAGRMQTIPNLRS